MKKANRFPDMSCFVLADLFIPKNNQMNKLRVNSKRRTKWIGKDEKAQEEAMRAFQTVKSTTLHNFPLKKFNQITNPT